MSRLLEFLLGSILIAIFTVGLMFFSAVHFVLREGNASDCTWQGSARAWIDSNGDGLVDRGEPPLGDVKIHVADVANQLSQAGWTAVTDKDGDVQFNIPVPGCVDMDFEIYADIPQRYRLTTMPRFEVYSNIWESLGGTRVYYFGFISER